MSATTSLNFEAGIAGLPPNLASFWGFRSGEGGSHSSRTIMLEELTQLFGAVPAVRDRLNEATLDATVRNACSSWTQSGHLRGRGRKIRQRVAATPAAVAYALLLGFAVGHGGRSLFGTPWAEVLDAPANDLSWPPRTPGKAGRHAT